MDAMPNTPSKDEAVGFKAGWTPAKPVDPNAVVAVSLKLPAPIHRQLRLKTVIADLTLNEAITQAIEDWLAKP
jgi:hypothetical protein